jgi:hypothetical protein
MAVPDLLRMSRSNPRMGMLNTRGILTTYVPIFKVGLNIVTTFGANYFRT